MMSSKSCSLHGVIDGARTRDSQNHNLELYQLSYDHHWGEIRHDRGKIRGKRNIREDGGRGIYHSEAGAPVEIFQFFTGGLPGG